MNKKGYLAAVLFCALSFGGVLALFQQSDSRRRAAARGMRSMNVSSPENNVFKEIVPAAIEHEAFLQSQKDTDSAQDDRTSPGKRLSLR